MRALAWLVAAEFVVLVLLAVSWLARPSAGAEDRHGSSGPTSPKAVAVPANSAPTPTTLETNAPATERQAAAAAEPDVTSGDPLGILVSGTVRSSDGKPIEGASVGWRREDTYRYCSSTAPGSYALTGLLPGEWQLTCRAEGFVPHEATSTLDQRAFQRFDVTLTPAFRVRVKLQGTDGQPILDELEKASMTSLPTVVATEEPLTGDLPPTEHSGLSRFGLGEWVNFGGLFGREPALRRQGYYGELRLHRPPPAFVSLLLRNTLLQGQRLEQGQRELVFTLAPADLLAKHGTLQLRLLDGATGAPLVKANVAVRTAQGGGRSETTGDDGRVTIPRVLPGLGLMEIQSRDRETLTRYVRVSPGAVSDLGNLTLWPVVKLTGRIVDPAGQAVNGASLQWSEVDGRTFPQPLVDFRSAGAEADGTFQLGGCGRRRYVVSARCQDGRLGFATIDASGGAPAPVTITVGAPAKVLLRATFPVTLGYSVTVLAADRSPVAVATLGSHSRPGSITLPRGTYTVEIHDLLTDRLVRSQPLQVGAEPQTLDVP